MKVEKAMSVTFTVKEWQDIQDVIYRHMGTVSRTGVQGTDLAWVYNVLVDKIRFESRTIK